MSYARIEHAGGAVTSALNTDIGAGDTSLVLTVATNWPTGGTGPFYLVIDPGLAGEEKILATTRSTTTLSGLTRGIDGTTGAAHSAGAVIKHIFTAVEADEANQTVHATLGAIAAKGDVLTGSAANSIVKTTAGADNTLLIFDSSQTGGVRAGNAAVVNGGTGATTLTAHGLLVGNGTSAVAGITAGTNGQLPIGQTGANPAMTTVTGDVTITNAGVTAIGAGKVTVAQTATVPMCSVSRSTDQTIADSTDTVLTFDTEAFDTDTMHSTVSNTGRITFTTTGYYLIEGGAAFDINAVGHRQLQLRVNGSTIQKSTEQTTYNTVTADMEITRIGHYTATDYVELLATQTSGGNLKVVNNVWGPRFAAAFLSAG